MCAVLCAVLLCSCVCAFLFALPLPLLSQTVPLFGGSATTWTFLQHDGPNHLGLWYNAAPWASSGPNHLGMCRNSTVAEVTVALQTVGPMLLEVRSERRCLSSRFRWHFAKD